MVHHISPLLIPPRIALLGVLLASVGFGLVPLFARGLTDGGMAPHAIAFARYIVATLAFSPALFAIGRDQIGAALWGAGAGAAMGVGWIGYVAALKSAPVASVSVLYMTYPVFTLLIGKYAFGDRPQSRAWIAALIILVAAALAIGPGSVPVTLWPVLALSLAAPAGFGLGINVLVHKLVGLPALTRIACVTSGSVIGLLPLVVTTPVGDLAPDTANGWWLVAGIALGSALIPQLIYTVCAPVIGTARTAIAGSVELPTMLMIGWLALGEHVGLAQWVACVMVVGAIALTPRPRAISAGLGKPD